MCGYFCIEFIDFMLKVNSLLDHTNEKNMRRRIKQY